jgi:hypothetical protein
MKILHPEVFQGNFRRRRYFEGWYLKHVSQDLQHVISIIPGVSLTKHDPHGFIQILNGITGESVYTRYPLSDCSFSETSFDVRIGKSTFSLDGITLDIQSETLQLQGSLTYGQMQRYPSSRFSSGIMGWYSFVPFMECKHDVVSMRHLLDGSLTLNGDIISFADGTGYIEKDWGRSFPESWIWAQGNTFSGSDASFMLSVAKIPWLGKFFIGSIAYLSVAGKTYTFATYNGAKVKRLSFANDTLTFQLVHSQYTLSGTVQQQRHGTLHAPVSGTMSRMIKESADADITLHLTDHSGRVLFDGRGRHGGLEVIEALFKHFRS